MTKNSDNKVKILIHFSGFFQKVLCNNSKFTLPSQFPVFHYNSKNFQQQKTLNNSRSNKLLTCIQFPFSDESLPSRSEVLLENGYTSEPDKRKKSKKETEQNITMNQQQLMELENQLVLKIMKHFKDNFNYSPAEKERSEDIFYSPIGESPKLFIELIKAHFKSCNGHFKFKQSFFELFIFSPQTSLFTYKML